MKAMTERIAHRGPDGEGFFVDDKCGLGHRRLAIIDLKTGDQPIYNEDKTIVVVFNGEIYNFQTLRQELEEKGHRFQTQTDTEVLVHGYEEWGGALTEKLRGMYAFAIWDTVKESLFLARDKWGIKPLYYYQTDHSLLFASEIKAFLDHPDFQKQLNEEILAAYLCFNSVPTEETLFKNVFRLEPGHRMMYQAGKITIEKFFELDLDDAAASKTYDPETAAQEIRAAMEDSVKAHGFADVEIGGFLSSGIDSSYLVSLAKPDKTFTVGYDDPKYDEISYAKDLAEKLQIKNFSRTITKEDYIKAFPDIVYHMDEPLADPSAIALYFVAETAAKQVKVVTSGEGADELFGGYLTYREEIDQQGYMKIPFPLRRAASAIAGLFPEFPGRNFIYRRGKKLEEYYIGLGRVFEDKEAVSILKNKTQICLLITDLRFLVMPLFFFRFLTGTRIVENLLCLLVDIIQIDILSGIRGQTFGLQLFIHCLLCNGIDDDPYRNTKQHSPEPEKTGTEDNGEQDPESSHARCGSQDLRSQDIAVKLLKDENSNGEDQCLAGTDHQDQKD